MAKTSEMLKKFNDPDADVEFINVRNQIVSDLDRLLKSWPALEQRAGTSVARNPVTTKVISTPDVTIFNQEGNETISSLKNQMDGLRKFLDEESTEEKKVVPKAPGK